MKLRLTAGSPAAHQSGGTSARPHDWSTCEIDPCKACDSEVVARVRSFTPRDFEPVLLKCGCKIPWPVISLLGSHGQQVQCDEHGYQRIAKDDITKAKRGMEQCQTDPSQLTLLDSSQFADGKTCPF